MTYRRTKPTAHNTVNFTLKIKTLSNDSTLEFLHLFAFTELFMTQTIGGTLRWTIWIKLQLHLHIFGRHLKCSDRNWNCDKVTQVPFFRATDLCDKIPSNVICPWMFMVKQHEWKKSPHSVYNNCWQEYCSEWIANECENNVTKQRWPRTVATTDLNGTTPISVRNEIPTHYNLSLMLVSVSVSHYRSVWTDLYGLSDNMLSHAHER